jgi:hypothetical protein
MRNPQCRSGTNTGKIDIPPTAPLVMPGLAPGIHAFATAAGGGFERGDGRDKPGHDGL